MDADNIPDDLMSSERLATFSDGVFAIAITLLVLDLKVPEVARDLRGALLDQWPTYVSYLASFVVIGTTWINHHSAFRYFKRADHGLVLLNTLLLIWVALIPFPTALLARYIESSSERSTAAVIYGGLLFLSAFTFNLIWVYVRLHPYLTDRDGHFLARMVQRSLFGSFLYFLAFALAFVSIWASLACDVVVVFVFLLPRSIRHKSRPTRASRQAVPMRKR